MNQVNSQIIDLMLDVSRLIKGNVFFHAKSHQLTLLQVQILFFLQQKGTASMKEIAVFLNTTTPTATDHLNKLAHLRYIKRDADPEDRRIVNISLTNQAKEILSEFKQQKAQKMNTVLSLLSDEEKEHLVEIFHRLKTKLEQTYER